MADDNYFTGRIEQDVLQRFPGRQPAEFASDRRSKDNRMRVMLDGLIDDRGSRRSRLQQLRLNRATPSGETGTRSLFSVTKDAFPARDLVRKFGVEGHGLHDLHDIDDGDVNVLVIRDLFDDLEQSLVAGSPADRNDQSMCR